MRKIFSLLFAALMSATMFAATYTVVGASAITGSNWDYTDASNDMTLVSGTTYQLVKSDLALEAGDYIFKVCVDHSYETEYPSGYGNNATVNIAATGKYKITFTFDSNSHDVNAVAEKTGDAVVVSAMKVKGAWDGWNEHEMTIAGDNKTASVTITISAVATYEFGLDKAGSFIANGATLTRESNSGVVTSNVSNMKLEVDAIGDYTFTWTYETNTLVVTYPVADPNARPTVQMKGSWDDWADAVDFVWADDKTTASVTKNLTKDVTYNFKMIIGGQWKSKDWNINREYNTVESITENPTENINITADVTGDYKFTWTYATNTLVVTYPTSTALDNAAVEAKAVKVVRNGMLLIEKDGKTYNVLGTVVR